MRRGHSIMNRQQRKKLLIAELQRIVDLLIHRYQPERIYLFGSLASGHVREWSDIDLVIVKKTDRRFLDRIKDVLLLLHPKIGCDIVVYTPDELREMKKKRFFAVEVEERGKIIYEAA